MSADIGTVPRAVAGAVSAGARATRVRPMPQLPRVPRVDGRQLRWESHNAERRELVLNAAVELIEQQPPGAEIHVQQIAEQAGLVRTVVYRLFNGRAELNRAVQRHVVAQIREALGSHLRLEGSAESIIGSIVGAYVEWVAAHPSLHEMSERELGDGEPGELERAIDDLGTEIAGLVKTAASMLGSPLDDEHLAVLDLLVVGLIGQVRGSVKQWIRMPDRTVSAAELTATLSRWVWFQINGEAREMGVVIDPTVPVDQLTGTTSGP